MDELAVAKQELFTRIERWTNNERHAADSLPGMVLYRQDEPSGPTRFTHRPSVCLIAQGEKRILLGSDYLYYDKDRFLVTSIDLPIVAQVEGVNPGAPYLGLIFHLDQKEISDILAEGQIPVSGREASDRAMTVGALTVPLVRAFLRLIDLMDEPQAIPFLAPAIKREILYRLLTGEGGYHLRQVGLAGSQNSHIQRAVEWLKTNFSRPLLVETLADYCQMSLSAFHHHFRRVTAMSPLQYQKWLRLQEARRLMLTADFDVTRAAFKVGYESSSQFSREYSRLFGNSPSRDIRSLKDSGRVHEVAS